MNFKIAKKKKKKKKKQCGYAEICRHTVRFICHASMSNDLMQVLLYVYSNGYYTPGI